jgi:hypothetical protein
MRTQGLILVRERTSLRLVDSAAARIALHRSACSRGYKLSREGADPSLVVFLSVESVRCDSIEVCFNLPQPLDVAPASLL